MTRETTSFVYVTYIRSTPQKVFEAITRPEVARRYWAHGVSQEMRAAEPSVRSVMWLPTQYAYGTTR